MTKISQIWPFNIRAKERARRLRRECLDELLQETRSQGLNLIPIIDAEKGGKYNQARIYLEDLKKQGKTRDLDYEIELFVRECEVPLVRNQKPGLAMIPDHSTAEIPLPSGYIDKPIGEVENPEYTEYQKQAKIIRDEMIHEKKEKQAEATRQLHIGLRKEIEAWETISMEEWQRRYEEKNGECPRCDGGRLQQVIEPYQNPDNVKCGVCHGKEKLSLEEFRFFYKPLCYVDHYNDPKDDFHFQEQIIKRINETLECPKPKMFFVYAKITPKEKKQ